MFNYEVDIYVGTMAVPNELYFGVFKDKKSNIFKGEKGYWIIWDDGEMNAARLVVDENGRPAGFIPRMFPDGSVYGYVRK